MQWRQGLVIGALVVGLGGLVVGAQRLVTRFHPTTTIGQSSANTLARATSVQSEVDPGTRLTNKLAPNFTLTNQFGRSFSLRQLRGKVVVLRAMCNLRLEFPVC